MTLLTVGAVVFEAALLGAVAVAVRRENAPAAVNAGGAALLTLIPPALVRALGVDGAAVGVPGLTCVIAFAGVLHSLGMLGYYESITWWDHLTHTLSAALLAALLYAGLLVTAPAVAVVGTLFGTLAFGVVWEIGELVARDVAERYDVEPVLVHYGWRDTALDLVFDAVGAALVVGANVRLFVPTVEAVLRAVGVA